MRPYAKVAPCGHFQAYDVPSIRGMRRIQSQYFILTVAHFEAGCQHHLYKLLKISTLRPFTRQPNDLLCKRTAATHYLACCVILPHGIDNRYRVKARMAVKVLILKVNDALPEFIRNRILLREAPLAVPGYFRPQQFAFTALYNS